MNLYCFYSKLQVCEWKFSCIFYDIYSHNAVSCSGLHGTFMHHIFVQDMVFNILCIYVLASGDLVIIPCLLYLRQWKIKGNSLLSNRRLQKEPLRWTLQFSTPLPVILGTWCAVYGQRSAEVVHTGHQCVTQCYSVVIRHPEFSTAITYAAPDL
jgi:hypothetical protein